MTRSVHAYWNAIMCLFFSGVYRYTGVQHDGRPVYTEQNKVIPLWDIFSLLPFSIVMLIILASPFLWNSSTTLNSKILFLLKLNTVQMKRYALSHFLWLSFFLLYHMSCPHLNCFSFSRPGCLLTTSLRNLIRTIMGNLVLTVRYVWSFFYPGNANWKRLKFIVFHSKCI